MTSSPLSRALHAGLLEIDEESEVVHIETAAAEVADQLFSDRRLLQKVSYALGDASATHQSPGFAEAAHALEKCWRVYRSKYAAGADTILRALLVEAVFLAAHRDPEAAALVWYAGSPAIEATSSHALSTVWRSVVEAAGQNASETAASLWGLQTTQIEIGTIPNIKPSAFPKPETVSEEWLGRRLASAAGLSSYGDESVENFNGHTPNQGEAWSGPFVERTASMLHALSDHLQKWNAEANQAFETSLQTSLNSFATGARRAVRDVLNSVIQRQRILDRRSELLWWSRTCHSPSRQRSYRSMEAALVPFIAAVDLANLVGGIAPLSVEGLLSEMILSLSIETSDSCDVAQAMASNDGQLEELTSQFAVDLDEERVPLVRALASHVFQGPKSCQVATQFPSADALAVALYRSVQAHNLAYNVA